jgi:hypothetical protein
MIFSTLSGYQFVNWGTLHCFSLHVVKSFAGVYIHVTRRCFGTFCATSNVAMLNNRELNGSSQSVLSVKNNIHTQVHKLTNGIQVSPPIACFTPCCFAMVLCRPSQKYGIVVLILVSECLPLCITHLMLCHSVTNLTALSEGCLHRKLHPQEGVGSGTGSSQPRDQINW